MLWCELVICFSVNTKLHENPPPHLLTLLLDPEIFLVMNESPVHKQVSNSSTLQNISKQNQK